MHRLIYGLLALFLSTGAFAQQPIINNPIVGLYADCSTSVATSATAVLTASPSTPRKKIMLQNQTSSSAICFSFTTTTPTCGATGVFTLPASGSNANIWQTTGDFVPQNALTAVAATGTAQLTCSQFQSTN